MRMASPRISSSEAGAALASELRSRVSACTIIKPSEPLARRTTLRVGGPADLYVEPASESDLAAVIRLCRERQTPFFILGRGSNLLVKDGGYRGAVICLANSFFEALEVREPRLICGAGARLKTIAIEARRHALAGLEFLEGIPGSLGGALRMNAGAMGSCISDIVESVRAMDFEGTIHIVEASRLEARYRSCHFFGRHIALGATLLGRRGEADEITRRMKEFSGKRWATQPAAPSAGCIFQNPATIPAGKLIDQLGLKGVRVGGAMVSLEHGNFLVTDPTATASDVLALIELVRQRAQAERGIKLETEVQIIGE